MLKVVTKTLKITEDNLKENIFVSVVVIYDVNLVCNDKNFTFSRLSVFLLTHASMSLYNFCFDLLYGRVIFSHALQDHS